MRSVFSIRKFSSQNSRLVFQSKKPHWLIMKPCSYNMYSTYELNPKQEVDLMVATTSVRPDREMVMDFTIPFYYDTSTLLMKKPDPNEKKLFILAKPLRWEVNINDIDTLSAQNYFHFLLLLMSRIVSMGVTCIMPHTNMIAVSLVQERFLWFANKTRTNPQLYMYKRLCITGNGMHGGSSGSFCLLFVYNRTTVSILQSPWYTGSTGFPALLLVHVWCSADSRYSATKNYEQK